MTDKKFTDEDIISSLEVIATTGNCNECKIRNCKWGTCNCSQITANAALDLIGNQKTEIDRLKSELSNTRMKTRNDILAEYVRSRYPEIEKTFDFAAYSAGVALKEFGRYIKEAFGGTGKEVDDVCDSESEDG